MLLGLTLAAALSFDQIFANQPPWGSQPERITWAPNGSSILYVLPAQDGADALPIRQLDLKTGQTRILIDPSRYPGKAQTPSHVTWSPDGTRVAFSLRGTLYVRDMSTGLDRIVAQDAGDAQWSPDGNAIAYTHRANLYAAYLERKLRTVQLTADGSDNAILDGTLDWVYPEELGTERGFSWSPSGHFIAYLRMDERAVTNFPIVDFLNRDNAVKDERYPLAGEKNPAVTLHVVDVRSGSDRTPCDAAAHDEYIPAFGWEEKRDVLQAEVLDRAQQHVRVLEWPPGRSQFNVVYEQASSSWVDVIPLPVWLKDGTSLWLLDRENAKGVYVRNPAGAFTRLTGAYHVFQIFGENDSTATVYVSAAYPTRRDRSLLAVPLTGGPAKNLTPERGDHAVSVSPAYDSFVDTSSTLDDPPQTAAETIAGSRVLTMAARNDALRAQLLPTEQLEIDSKYGPLDAYMIRPANFDPAKKYPAIVYAYGGPEAPTTANRFGRMRGLYHQMLAQSGFVVFSIDGPASQFANSAGVRLLYRNFGPGSLLGQEIGAQYLRSLRFIDPSRIGIWGWSFGGYETLYALEHSTSFKAGVAGSPVTDWHLYDSIYTERYMGLPEKNAAAYDRSSALLTLAALNGDVLVNHGTSDDNVHMANTISFVQAAIAANKTNVDLAVYPRQLHGYTSLASLRHIYEHMLQWWKSHL